MAAPRKLPPALARRAMASAETKRSRLLADARAAIAEIRRKQAQIADAFYEVGELLVRLKKDPIPKLLGRKSFAEVCELDLGMSHTRCEWLIAVAERVAKDDAIAWGSDKTMALLELAKATTTNGAVDGRTLRPEKLRRPDGKPLDPNRESAAAIRRFAKEVRAKRGKGSVRGRTTTREERALAAAIAAILRREQVDAKVEALATKPGHPSKLRVEVPMDAIATLAFALRSAGREAG